MSPFPDHVDCEQGMDDIFSRTTNQVSFCFIFQPAKHWIFQRFQSDCLFGVNTHSGECLTPEEYLKSHKGEQNDECKDKNCDIVITITQGRDRKTFWEGLTAYNM